jgi:S1-C subfamily serine protease
MRWACAVASLWAALGLAEPAGRSPPPKPLPGTVSPPPSKGASYCPGEYADDFSALLPKARELEQQLAAYTFCIRTSATYECPSYGPDGNLKRKKRRVVAHGTGIAYRQDSGDTLLLTNEHVAEWPAVTDEEHPVEDIPPGCKRVADALKIVDSDSDSYEGDDIPLQRVVADPQLDIAVLKAKGLLPVLPWKIGRSAGLKERNVVDVRGFPLGVFKATNVGKVISAYDHDGFRDWDHDDFVVDALLSPGNSGSPVFAISCKTGEFELVGIYHAGYTHGSALNVVVGIDQVRDLMTTLKRVPRPRTEANAALDGAARAQLLAAAKLTLEPFFAFGSVTAAVRTREDGALLYEVLNRDFPFRGYPALVLEDLPTQDASAFGTPGRVWIGNRQGLKSYVRSDLDVDTQAQLARLLEGLRRESVVSFAVRTADHDASSSKEKFQHTERLEKALQRSSASYSELAQSTGDLSDRFGPSPGEPSVALESTLVAPPSPAQAAGAPPAPVSALSSASGKPLASGAVPDASPAKQPQAAPQGAPSDSKN